MLMMYYVRFPDGTRWRVLAARSLQSAVNEICFAKACGSVGSKSFSHPVNELEYGLADVHQVNSDNTLRQPYTEAY